MNIVMQKNNLFFGKGEKKEAGIMVLIPTSF
jgi:hypothetical protein